MIPPQPPASPIDIVVGPLSPADETGLNDGLKDVDLITVSYPAGEIRGQIIPDTVGVRNGTWGVVKKLYD